MWNGRTPAVRRVRPDDVPDRPRARGRATSTARPRSSRPTCSARRATPRASCASRRRAASRWCSTPRTRSASLADGRPIGGFGDAEVFSLTPTKVLVAGEGGLVATSDAGLAKTLRIGRDYGNPGDYNTRFVGLERAHVGVPRGDGARIARDVRRDARPAPQARRALHRPARRASRASGAKRCPSSTRRRTRTSRSPSSPTSGSVATTSSSRSRPKASRPATTSIRRCTASRRTRRWTRETSPSPTRCRRRSCRCRSTTTSTTNTSCASSTRSRPSHEYASELDDARNKFETRSPRTSSTLRR